MQNFDDFARSVAGRVLDALLPALAERLAETLKLDVVLELENHIADGKAGEVADWAVRGCSDALASAADRLGWPESFSSEGRCARCGGLGRCGVLQVSRNGSYQWEEKPSECFSPDGCGWPDETWMPLSDDEKASRDEMRRTVEEADEAEFRQAERGAWTREQWAKAPEVLAVLLRHIPADRMEEVEGFLSSGHGCTSLRDALRRDLTRKGLRNHVPPEHWHEIESYLDTGVGTRRVSAALSASGAKAGWGPRWG